MKVRTRWNKRKDMIVRYVGNATTFQNRLGKVIGCLRGDHDINDPYVAVWYFTNVDGTPINGFYWDTPATSLEVISLYHVTTKNHLKKIKKDKQITPSIPDDMDDKEAVYLFPSKVDVENAMMNWLGDRFDEKDETVLLTIDQKDLHIQIDGQVSWEFHTEEPIPYKNIVKVEDI